MPSPTQSASEDRLRSVSSRSNASVKELRRLFHDAAPDEKGEIAVEGMHLVEEAIRSSLRISTVFFAESARERAHKLLPQLPRQTQALLVPDEVFSSAVPSESPQGVAAMVAVNQYSLAEALRAQPALLVLTAGLQDPGNLGTIARAGEAFGATALLIAENTVSAWNWKSIRASSGSLFRVPVAKVEISTLLPELKARGIIVLATSSHKGASISEADLRRPLALIVGNEGAGVPKNVLAQADEVVTIPHSEKVESLNAAIAASVVLYEASRQRKKTSHHRGH
jgi:TrmH family RNA methyltransferase